MKIVTLSDTHNFHDKAIVPNGDMLIFAGDMSQRGTFKEVKAFADWFETQPHKYKVFIAGNHDFLFERDNGLARSLFPTSIYLENSGVEIEGYKIWGSPITPFFYDWAFNKHRGKEIRPYWDAIPQDTNILITHGPIHGIMDETEDGDLCGCEQLAEKVIQLKDLRLFSFGHIHEGTGFEIFNNKTAFVNASFCDRRYKNFNQPFCFDLSKEEIRKCD